MNREIPIINLRPTYQLSGASLRLLSDSRTQFEFEADPRDIDVTLYPILAGPPGPPGPPGAGANFVEQAYTGVTSATLNHNLGRIPKVEFRTTGGLPLILQYQHFSVNQVRVGPLPVPMDFIINVS